MKNGLHEFNYVWKLVSVVSRACENWVYVRGRRKTRSPEINIRQKLRDEFGIRCVWRHFDFVVYKIACTSEWTKSIWYEFYWVGGMLNTYRRRIKYALDFTHRVPRASARIHYNHSNVTPKRRKTIDHVVGGVLFFLSSLFCFSSTPVSILLSIFFWHSTKYPSMPWHSV